MTRPGPRAHRALESVAKVTRRMWPASRLAKRRTVWLKGCTRNFEMNSIGTTRKWRAKRSEEHTSELQSLMRISYAVFCLKKKKLLSFLDQKRTLRISIP